MASLPAPPPYSTRFDARPGTAVEIDAGIVRVTAPNSGPYTFTGTNTFVLGADRLAILDPGPASPAHMAALQSAIGGRPVDAIVLTHTHKDHCGLARQLRAATGAPIWSGGPHRLSRPRRPFEFNPFARAGDFTLEPDRTLGHGDVLALDGLSLEVIATPGHCANHLAFAVRDREQVFTGDHVMGWSSTVIGVPDGDLGDYLASLDTLIALPRSHYLPAHGGPIADGRGFAHALKAHRLMRNGQIVDALSGGPLSLGGLTARVYPDLGGPVRIAARRTLLAHLEYLEAEGKVALRRWPGRVSARLVF